jgi:hypothetical protein
MERAPPLALPVAAADYIGIILDITINEVLQAYIDPLTANEYAALERSLLAEGCRDALVLWGAVLIDGHNRHAICAKHGIVFKTVQNTSFGSIDDVMLWMIDNHLARRNVSDFQRGVLALRKRELVAAQLAQRASGRDASADQAAPPVPINTRQEIAKAARVSSNTMGQIEKIQRAAAPELVEAVRSGTISINAAATVAELPQAQQVAAVAGGRRELQQAAKQVREQKASARPPKDEKEEKVDEVSLLQAQVAALKETVAALTAQNTTLAGKLAALENA